MKKYGLIGNPINHSLSPQIHQALFKALDVKGQYHLYPITDLEKELPLLLNMDIAGFNVTTPYKQKILTYLDFLDDSALLSGAVNTVMNGPNGWTGYNTDGRGLYEVLKPVLGINDAILIMGTGGAAFAIISSLLQVGYTQLYSAGRGDGIKAIDHHTKALFGKKIHLKTYDNLQIEHYKCIINATTVGMDTENPIELFPYSTIERGQIIVDCVYKQGMTPLLKAALQAGAATVSGLDMLLSQALYSQSIWQGRPLEWKAWSGFLKAINLEVKDDF